MAFRHEKARPSRARWLLLAIAALLLLAPGCDEDSGRRLTPPDSPEYLANDSADNLVANVIMAWVAEDAEGYAALLYDGVALATDSQPYSPFTFCYDRTMDPDLPEVDLYERELTRVGNLLGGLPGNGVPGVKSVAMNLTPNGVWSADFSGTGQVEDLYPTGTVWRVYNTDMLFTLKANVGDSNINQWLVEDRLIFHCLPIQIGDATEWRLWKWRDVIDSGFAREGGGSVAESSFSAIKALY